MKDGILDELVRRGVRLGLRSRTPQITFANVGTNARGAKVADLMIDGELAGFLLIENLEDWATVREALLIGSIKLPPSTP